VPIFRSPRVPPPHRNHHVLVHRHGPEHKPCRQPRRSHRNNRQQPCHKPGRHLLPSSLTGRSWLSPLRSRVAPRQPFATCRQLFVANTTTAPSETPPPSTTVRGGRVQPASSPASYVGRAVWRRGRAPRESPLGSSAGKIGSQDKARQRVVARADRWCARTPVADATMTSPLDEKR
jgi:hypothetical protein